MPAVSRLALFLPLVALTGLGGCDKPKEDERRGPPPPEVAVPTPGGCAQGGGTISDAVTAAFFPRTLADYCIDPLGETRTYGSAASREIDAICIEAFNGDCEMYKSFGLERVVILRYVDGSGSPGAIDVVVSKYGSAEGAFGMFTKRVISDGDPAREDAPKSMSVDGVGALGAGTAYLWKGQVVVELTYTNDQQTPQQVEAAGAKLLTELAKTVAGKLPAPATLPAAAARLPNDHRIPLGIRFEPKDAFGVQGGGAGAFGYYRQGAKRFRILSVAREDADQAKDVLTALAKREGAARIKDLGDGGVRLMVGEPDDARAEWVIARSGSQIFGVGDETAVLKPGMSVADHDEVSLTKDEKTERLRALLSAK